MVEISDWVNQKANEAHKTEAVAEKGSDVLSRRWAIAKVCETLKQYPSATNT